MAFGELPRLNLLSRPLLLGLTYRAMAGDADAAKAPLTQRRIEQVQAAITDLLQRASALRADVGIAAERADATRRHATRSSLDLQLFLESYEPPQRGLLRRPTREQRAAEARCYELESIAGADAAEAEAAQAQRDRVESALADVEGRLVRSRGERARLAAQLGEELAAHVLGLLAAGDAPHARDALERARVEVRGDPLIGSLLVLAELFAAPTRREGILAARRMLDQLEPLFEVTSDNSARLLALYLALLDGRRLSRQDLGLPTPGNFQAPALWRLHQLTSALAGIRADTTDASESWEETLRLCVEIAAGGLDSPSSGAHADSVNLPIQDPVRLLLTASLMMQHERLELLWRTLTREDDALRRTDPPMDLPTRLGGAIPAWPTGLREPVGAALACLTLLALFMAEGAEGTRASLPALPEDVALPHRLFELWLAESYGWPKTDLYWWMLSGLKGDPALLRNIGGTEDELYITRLGGRLE